MAFSKDAPILRAPQKLLRVEYKTLLKFHDPEQPGRFVVLSEFEPTETDSSMKRLDNLGLIRSDPDSINPSASVTPAGLRLIAERPTLKDFETRGPIVVDGVSYSWRGY